MTTLPVRPTIVACAHCGHALGTTNGQKLFVGAVVLWRPVALRCAVCGTKRAWQPDSPDRVLDSTDDLVPT